MHLAIVIAIVIIVSYFMHKERVNGKFMPFKNEQ
jgi:hypothetical protein